MYPDDRADFRGAASVLMRSYFSDLRRWAAGLSTRYIVAIAVALGGITAIFAACAVGISALFHLIESWYGTDAAYAAVGGGLFFIGIILLVLAWTMFSGAIPSVPRPHRQIRSARQMARQMIMQSPALGAMKRIGEVPGARTAPAIPVLMATGATLLVGWIVGSRVATRRRARRSRLDMDQ